MIEINKEEYGGLLVLGQTSAHSDTPTEDSKQNRNSVFLDFHCL